MAQRELPTTCGDCGGVLQKINLFARTYPNPLSGVASDSDLLFSQADFTRSTIWYMYDAEGSVHSLRCQACGRIALYGILRDEAERQMEAVDCLQCGARIDVDQHSCSQCGWSYR